MQDPKWRFLDIWLEYLLQRFLMNELTFGEWSVTTPKKLCSSAITLQSDLGMVGTDPLSVEYIRSGHSRV